ncbi:hypothetical protein PAPYR_12919 [Paratrimastix pyriformis]|uniref:Uncharacterized protein n=1 Tax=Paratrimastix pyriformis TaxID=342808 RepID=A0ABQ8U2P4_9EUKA|nr:hypothetical protein PAPYR_12919 [Paratrimastix pyriformis]
MANSSNISSSHLQNALKARHNAFYYQSSLLPLLSGGSPIVYLGDHQDATLPPIQALQPTLQVPVSTSLFHHHHPHPTFPSRFTKSHNQVLSCLHSTGQPNRPSPPIHPFLFHHLQPLTQLVPHIHPSVFPPLFQVYQRLRLSHPCSPYSPFHRSPPYHPIQIQPRIFRLQSTPPLFQSAKSEVMAQVCAKN